MSGGELVVSQPSQLVPPQPYILVPMGNVQTPVQFITPHIPNAPKTIVVDTSEQTNEYEQPRSILRRPGSPSRFRSRSPSQSFNVNKVGGSSITDASAVPTNTKINIVKQG